MFNINCLLVGYVLDLIFGDPYSFPHPVKFIGNSISALEKMFFSTKINKFISGVITCVIIVGGSYFITFLIVNLSYNLNYYLGFFIESFISYTIFSSKCLKMEAIKIYEKVKTKNLDDSRKALSYIVGRDTKELSFSDIIKATIETVAENTVDGVFTPIFFMIIGGVPLAMAFKAVSTLDSMIGYRNEKYERFGKFSARLDDVCNFIPARLSLLVFPISAFINRLDWKNCIKIGIRDRKNHLSPNCAYPESLMAGSLNIQLGGSHYYFGKLVEKPTIGDNTRDVENQDIIKTVNMLYTNTFIFTLSAYIILLYLC